MSKRNPKKSFDITTLSDAEWGEILATITVAENGGPIRTLITGREPHPTGTITSIKAGSRAMPWESIKAERPALIACETASPVRRLLAQQIGRAHV